MRIKRFFDIDPVNIGLAILIILGVMAVITKIMKALEENGIIIFSY